jgi:phosphoribosylamine---glycine ligase
MRILVVGSGGREHALAWKISRSPVVRELYAAPGNPGMAAVATLLSLGVDDLDGIVREARQRAIDLVVVGPEGPLVQGLADRLSAAGIAVFGPTAAAAEIEGSKAFAKEVMIAAGIPTAAHDTFHSVEPALRFARERAGRVAVKADGLAGGKGVVVTGSMSEAERALDDLLVRRIHGNAGARVVVEERLSGPEASVIAFTDGERVRVLPAAQDHKRVFDRDEGQNTGGMGAYSPTTKVTPAIAEEVERRVLLPALRQLARRGRPFRGALYAGLMLTDEGVKVIEFNARMGDPETQPTLMRVSSDIVPALLASAQGDLRGIELTVDERPAVGVVLAARGYPGKPEAGVPIVGAEGPFDEDVQVFHAGTARAPNGQLVTAGGRVLTVCALGRDLAQARERAYRALGRIELSGGHYRRDIGVL